jgi:CheY-like chemotaxis protein
MRAADTTRESVSSDQQLDETKSRYDCQDRGRYSEALSIRHRGSNISRASVLLLDSDLNHADVLTRSLHGAGYVVTTRSDIRSTLHTLGHCDFHIVILSSYRADEWKSYIDHILKITRKKKDPPHVVVLVRVYRGPKERLDAERKGVRLVYER